MSDASPTAQRVAANTRAIRRQRGLDLAEVADRLRRLGHPIAVNTLSKIELGKRRVDAADLLALALALETSPVRLVLSADADQTDLAVTEAVRATSLAAWRWAVGEEPLWGLWGDAGTALDLDRIHQFRSENRPHDTDDTTIETLAEHQHVLSQVAVAAHRARREGLPLSAIKSYLDLFDSTERLIAVAGTAREAREEADDDDREVDADAGG